MPQVRLVLLSLTLVMSLFAAPNAFGKGPAGGRITDQNTIACAGLYFQCESGEEICCYGSDEDCRHDCQHFCGGTCDDYTEG